MLTGITVALLMVTIFQSTFVSCAPPSCEDTHNSAECESWATLGECERNPGFMMPKCLKSCNKCAADVGVGHTDSNCQDIHNSAECQGWAIVGECERNPGFMIPKCMKSCKKCAGDVGVGQTNTDGGWTSWGSNSPCTKSCGGGIQFRERSCTNLRPANGSAQCAGNAKDTQPCNTYACPTIPVATATITPMTTTMSSTLAPGVESTCRSCEQSTVCIKDGEYCFFSPTCAIRTCQPLR